MADPWERDSVLAVELDRVPVLAGDQRRPLRRVRRLGGVDRVGQLTVLDRVKRERGDRSWQVGRFRLQDDDWLLLCSDGLTTMVPEEAIAGVLRVPGTSQSLCQRLIDLANAAGGEDNVTAILARYRIPEAPER